MATFMTSNIPIISQGQLAKLETIGTEEPSPGQRRCRKLNQNKAVSCYAQDARWSYAFARTVIAEESDKDEHVHWPRNVQNQAARGALLGTKSALRLGGFGPATLTWWIRRYSCAVVVFLVTFSSCSS